MKMARFGHKQLNIAKYTKNMMNHNNKTSCFVNDC